MEIPNFQEDVCESVAGLEPTPGDTRTEESPWKDTNRGMCERLHSVTADYAMGGGTRYRWVTQPCQIRWLSGIPKKRMLR